MKLKDFMGLCRSIVALYDEKEGLDYYDAFIAEYWDIGDVADKYLNREVDCFEAVEECEESLIRVWLKGE